MNCFRFILLLITTTISWYKIWGLEDKNWFFHSPQGTSMGLFIAVALPVDLMDRNVYLAYNFEFSYNIPGNRSEDLDVQYPPVILTQETKRTSILRGLLYDIFEAKINEFGFDGRNCLLKIICEFSMYSFAHNGILSDILHVILVPSSSTGETIHSDFSRAEINGKRQNCTQYSQCQLNVLSNLFY